MIETIYEQLMRTFRAQAKLNDLMDEEVTIRWYPMSPHEAIGDPDDRDYPIIKGKERIVEAELRGAKGHAYSDEFGSGKTRIKNLLEGLPRTNRERAVFIAALNATYRHLGLCEGTVHCKDNEPRECAEELSKRIGKGMNVLLVGLQPRMLEFVARRNPIRVVDLDPDNIGSEKYGVVIEGVEKTDECIEWCHTILATGSTIVNGSIGRFLDANRPAVFYGVTIAAAARILNLDRFCFMGR